MLKNHHVVSNIFVTSSNISRNTHCSLGLFKQNRFKIAEISIYKWSENNVKSGYEKNS